MAYKILTIHLALYRKSLPIPGLGIQVLSSSLAGRVRNLILGQVGLLTTEHTACCFGSEMDH